MSAADTAANEVNAFTAPGFGWRGLARGTTVAHRRFRLHSWRSYIRLEDCESKGARLTGGVRDPAGESQLQKVPCGCSGRLNALRSVILWLVDQRLYVVCLHLFRWERGKHSRDIRRPGTESITCEDVSDKPRTSFASAELAYRYTVDGYCIAVLIVCC